MYVLLLVLSLGLLLLTGRKFLFLCDVLTDTDQERLMHGFTLHLHLIILSKSLHCDDESVTDSI